VSSTARYDFRNVNRRVRANVRIVRTTSNRKSKPRGATHQCHILKLPQIVTVDLIPDQIRLRSEKRAWKKRKNTLTARLKACNQPYRPVKRKLNINKKSHLLFFSSPAKSGKEANIVLGSCQAKLVINIKRQNRDVPCVNTQECYIFPPCVRESQPNFYHRFSN
jgi:hypothetical protein